MDVPCALCGRPLAEGGAGPLASISGGLLGDEYTESWCLCEVCGVYTVEVYRDVFAGEGHASLRGPVPREEGDAQVSLIRACATPWDKTCRCAAHRRYFDETLD